MNEVNIREEYVAIRAEILQLNEQAFTLVGASLALNFVILGFGLRRHGVSDLEPIIPFIGVFILLVSNVLLSHKIRMAHRLAYYQKHFIEPVLPGVRWARIGSLFRKNFDSRHNRFVISIAERFVLVQTAVVTAAQIVNIFVMLLGTKSITWYLLVSITAVLLAVEVVLLRIINNYQPIDAGFAEIAASEAVLGVKPQVCEKNGRTNG
jgi:hypothetical protein